MKKTVPFKKDIKFKTNINELISIALDNDLHLEERIIKGNLIISGSYKINESSINVEEFKFTIPVNIEMNSQYNLDNLKIDIDDFYYEIIDNNILNVNVEIGLDNIEEVLYKKENRVIEETNLDSTKETNEELNKEEKIIRNEESYSVYHVYIFKENDTIEEVINKYNVSKEIIMQYNDISDLKIGDKLVIPSLNEKNN